MKSPYYYCFNVLWIGFSVTAIAGLVTRSAGSAMRSAAEGMSFILERGHENNAEVKQGFQKARQRHKLEGVLGVVSFMPSMILVRFSWRTCLRTTRAGT